MYFRSSLPNTPESGNPPQHPTWSLPFFFVNVTRTAAEALCARIRDTDPGVRCAATSVLPTLELEELNVDESNVPS